MKSLRSLKNKMPPTFQSHLSPLALPIGLVCGTALAGILGSTTPALAATITVGGACTLRDAITSANTNTATGGCIAGDAGLDTINIPAGTITVTGTPLPAITEPVTINGAGQTATVIDYNGLGGPGLYITSTAPGSTIQNLTIERVDQGAGVGSGTNIRVEAPNTTLDSIISQDSLGPDRNGSGIFFNGSTSNAANPPAGTFGSIDVSGSVVRNSIIQNNDNGGITLRYGASGVTIDNNQIRINAGGVPTNASATFGCAVNGTNRGGDANPLSDGVELVGANNITISNNIIECNAAYGIDLRSTPNDNNTISNNIIRANGIGASSDQDAGIGIRNGNDNTIINNTITANVNDGIVVSSGTNNRITQNSIFANGRNPTTGATVNAADRLAIDLGPGNTGDGVTLNDNNDTDGGPNERYNFPFYDAAIITNDNTQLILTGVARPGAIIELFTVTTPDPNNFGEAETFLLTETEGGPNDQTGGTGSYGPGIPPAYQSAQGQDTANRFTFVDPRPGPLTLGDVVTSTATNPTTLSTSELSGLVTTTAGLGVAKRVVSVTPVNATQSDVVFEVTIENLSTIELTNVTLTEDLATTFAGATAFNVQVAPAVTATNGPSVASGLTQTTAVPNGGFNGTGNNNLLGAATLGPAILTAGNVTRSFITVQFTVRVTPGNQLNYENVAVGGGEIGDTGIPLTDTSNDGLDVVDATGQDPTSPNNNTPTPISFGLQLIKRITRVVRNGVTQTFTAPTGNPPDPAFVGVITPPAPFNDLSSGDQVEYTIYYINSSRTNFTDVAICDPIPANTTFAADGFAAGSGIAYAAPANTLGAPTNLTNAADGDEGSFLAALAANGACPGGNAGAQGGVLVDVGAVNSTNGPPIADERGFVRFVTTVD